MVPSGSWRTYLMSNAAIIELLSGHVNAINIPNFRERCFNDKEEFSPSLVKKIGNRLYVPSELITRLW